MDENFQKKIIGCDLSSELTLIKCLTHASNFFLILFQKNCGKVSEFINC